MSGRSVKVGPRLSRRVTKKEFRNINKFLDKYAKYIVRQAYRRISQKDKVDTGWLGNSLAYKIKWRKGQFNIKWYYARYGEFIDKGVQGLGKGILPKNSTAGQHGGEKLMPNRTYVDIEGKRRRSPFRFKHAYMPKGLMEEFVRRKGIQINDKNDKPMSVAGMAWIIGRAIKAKGIPGISFYTQPLSWSRNKLNTDIQRMLGEDVKAKVSKDLKIKY